MDWIEALILGIVQGLTEFLPVSSSGHLAIGSALFGLPEGQLTFTVILHAATVLSTIVALRKEVVALLIGLFRFSWNEETRMVAKLLLSAVPVAIIGFCFKDFVEEAFQSLTLVGVMLMVTAVLLFLAYRAAPRARRDLGWKDVLLIGVAQACAVLPGLSRSGTTIATGVLLGSRKETVAKFSFLMVLIPIVGESFLELIKGDLAPSASGIPLAVMLTGFVSAFVTGFIACRWMIDIVKKGKWSYFAAYCAVLGAAVLIWQSF